MATLVPFQPTPVAVFQFKVVLDGSSYTVTVTWNAAGRWYINIYTTTGNQLVLSVARVESPADGDINLIAGYFKTSTLLYRESTGNFEINP